MKGTMKTAVMTAIGKVEIQERDIPAVKDDEVLVKLEYVGVCGSDLHFFEDGRIGEDVIATPPFVLGHEPGGVVVETGKNVKTLKPGDRVALEPGKTCGKCEMCKTGRYNLCPDVVFFAAPPYDGVFCEYISHPEDLCFKLPDGVSTLEGALIEPLAVGFHAANQGEAQAGQTAVVTGMGCIGLVCLMALKAKGVDRVIAVDIVENRLQKALELGAGDIINSKTQDLNEAILALTGGKGADLVVDTSGSETVVSSAVRFAKKGANVVLVGYSHSGYMNLPTSLFVDKELCLKSVFRYRNIYPMAIQAVADGRINLKGIVSNVFPFADIQNALDSTVQNRDTIIKSVIKM